MISLLLPIIAVTAGLLLLLWGADKFVDGAADLARHFGISSLLVGMIVIGFGTSAPEMLISSIAALADNSDLGIGNAVGSNITNIAMVLGISALFYNLPVHSSIIQREIPILLAASVAAYAMINTQYFSRGHGLALLGGLFLLLWWMVNEARTQPKSEAYLADLEAEFRTTPHKKGAILWTLSGLVVLLGSSWMLVWGASSIATWLGVSQLIIGLTIVAIGTSLPELAATLVSARKGETDLAVGNIVGSNMFNTLGVLALPALINPGIPDENVIYRDMPVMLGLTVILLVFAHGCFKSARRVINRWKGAILFAIFVAYEIVLYIQASHKITCQTYLHCL